MDFRTVSDSRSNNNGKGKSRLILKMKKENERQSRQLLSHPLPPQDNNRASPECPCRHTCYSTSSIIPRRKKRPRSRFDRPSTLWPSAFFLAVFTTFCPAQQTLVQAQITSIENCITSMAISDTNRDINLDRGAEYVNFINMMSANAFGAVAFEELPLPITTHFDVWAGNDGFLEIDGSTPGVTPTPKQQERLDAICYDTITVLAQLATKSPSLAPSIAPSDPPPTMTQPVDNTFAECLTDMSVADLSRDAALETSEYVRYVNFMSDGQYGFTSYEALPELMRFNFVVLSTVDSLTGFRSIDITGSSPGDDLGAIPLDQVEFLMKICSQTQTAINTVNLFIGSLSAPNNSSPSAPILSLPTQSRPLAPIRPPSSMPPSSTTAVPTTSQEPTIRVSQRQTTPYNECRISIAIADRSRDSLITENEYVQLVHRLSNSETYRFATFDTLPAVLRNNFISLAAQGQTIGQIDVYGAYPLQTPTEEEQAFLELVCFETENAIAAVPTPAPVVSPTPAPTEDFSECRQHLVFSDTSPRNNFLGTSEYVIFVNYMSTGAFLRNNFLTLPKVLRDNFDTLASVERENPEENGNGDAIYIYGSMPLQAPGAVQFEFLRRVCEETELAVAVALGAPTAPIAPTTPAPFLPPIATSLPATPAPSTMSPATIPTTIAPVVITTSNPTVPPTNVGQPTTIATPLPTPIPTAPPTNAPIGFSPTNPPTPASDEESDGGGINVGVIVGGVVGGVAGLCIVCVGCYVFSAKILALLACCGYDEGGNRKEKVNANRTDAGDGSRSGSDREEGDDNFNGFGQPGTPKPGEGTFENISVADSPKRSFGGGDVETGGRFQGPPPELPSKEFGQYGGPNLPMNFGVDLEDMDEFESNSTSSGSREMLPSDNQSYGDDTYDDEEEGESQSEDNEEQDGWGQGFGQDQEEDFDASGSYSAEDDQEDYDEAESQVDEEEEEGSSYEDEENGAEDAEGDKSSPESFGNAFGADGFGEFSEGFEEEDQEGGFAFGGADGFGEDNEADEEEVSYESGSGSGTYEDEEMESLFDDESPEDSLEKKSAAIDQQIEDADWESVIESVKSFDHDPSEESEGSYEEDISPKSSSGEKYRARVEELVNRVIPDERDNIDDMLEQFKGREDDLVKTLMTMEEKSGGGGVQSHETDEQSQYSQETEEQSQYSQESDEQSQYSQETDNQSQYSQETEEQSQYSEEADDQSQYSQETDEQSQYSQGTDEQSQNSQGTDDQSQYSQETDNQSEYSGEADDQSEYSGDAEEQSDSGSYTSGDYDDD